MGHRPVGQALPPLRFEDGGLMARKHKRKVALPTDRTGTPIRIGDVLEWEDGTRLRARCKIRITVISRLGAA